MKKQLKLLKKKLNKLYDLEQEVLSLSNSIRKHYKDKNEHLEKASKKMILKVHNGYHDEAAAILTQLIEFEDNDE